MARMSPMGALVRGLVAGAVGSATQDLFFRATKKLAPATPEGVFTPPEPEQKDETATQTLARRVGQELMQRGPLSAQDKARGGEVVHYAFGAAWGGLYGLAAGSAPWLDSPLGGLAFGTLVWMVGDNTLLPVFRLAAWPRAYPAKTHAYAWAAHAVYGATLWASFEALQRGTWFPLAAALGARRATRRVPRFARPAARKVVVAARSVQERERERERELRG